MVDQGKSRDEERPASVFVPSVPLGGRTGRRTRLLLRPALERTFVPDETTWRTVRCNIDNDRVIAVAFHGNVRFRCGDFLSVARHVLLVVHGHLPTTSF